MRTVTLRVVSLSQKREIEPFGNGVAEGLALGETKSSAVVKIDGSDDPFLVRIPNDMYEAIVLAGSAEELSEQDGEDKEEDGG